MLASLQAFLKNTAPSRAEAAGALRTLFVLAFGGQTALALLAWAVLLLAVRPETAPIALTAQVLLGFAVLILPLSLGLSSLQSRSGKQAGALSATLLQGILLASPVWFAVFTWLIGSPSLYSFALLGLAALYYGLGVLVVGRHAAQATELEPPRAQ